MSNEALLFLALVVFWFVVFSRPRRPVVYHSPNYHAFKRQQLESEMRADEERWEREEAHHAFLQEQDERLFRMKRDTDQRHREHQQQVDEQVRRSREEAANHVLALHREYIFNKGRR